MAAYGRSAEEIACEVHILASLLSVLHDQLMINDTDLCKTLCDLWMKSAM